MGNILLNIKLENELPRDSFVPQNSYSDTLLDLGLA